MLLDLVSWNGEQWRPRVPLVESCCFGITRVLDLIKMEVGAFSVSCHFIYCEHDFGQVFTRVYGPTLSRERENFWIELRDIRGLWSDPWCVGGDFNMVRFLSKRRNKISLRASTR